METTQSREKGAIASLMSVGGKRREESLRQDRRSRSFAFSCRSIEGEREREPPTPNPVRRTEEDLECGLSMRPKAIRSSRNEREMEVEDDEESDGDSDDSFNAKSESELEFGLGFGFGLVMGCKKERRLFTSIESTSASK